MRLLMINESKVMLDMMNKMIKSIPGIEIVGNAQTCHEAITLFSTHRPEVVFLDVHLQKGNSLEVMKTIKNKAPSVFVFVSVMQEYYRYKRDYEKLGADFLYDRNLELSQALDKLKELNCQSRDEKRMN